MSAERLSPERLAEIREMPEWWPLTSVRRDLLAHIDAQQAEIDRLEAKLDTANQLHDLLHERLIAAEYERPGHARRNVPDLMADLRESFGLEREAADGR